MSCGKVKKLLVGYVDGDLDQKREDEVREHLGGCARCRVLAEKLETSSAALSSLRPVELSDAASVRILGAVEASGAPRKALLPGGLRSPAALAAGACVALILLSVVVVGVLVVDFGKDAEGPTPAVTEEKVATEESDLAYMPTEGEQSLRDDTGNLHGPAPTPVVKATSTDYTEESLREMFENLEVKETFGQRYTMGNAIGLGPSFVDKVTSEFEGLGQDPAVLESMISYVTVGEPTLLTCYVEKALFHGIDVTIIGFCAPPRSGTTTLLTRTEAWVMDPVKFVTSPSAGIVHFLEMK